jgi:uncharacterized protein (DUF1501 family)
VPGEPIPFREIGLDSLTPVWTAVGAPVAGGVLGDHPSLTDLDKGGLKTATDVRNVYAGITRDWMGVDPSKVIGEEFSPMSLLS